MFYQEKKKGLGYSLKWNKFGSANLINKHCNTSNGECQWTMIIHESYIKRLDAFQTNPENNQPMNLQHLQEIVAGHISQIR